MQYMLEMSRSCPCKVSELANMATASLQFCKLHALWIESLMGCRYLRRLCERVCTLVELKDTKKLFELAFFLFFFSLST